MVTATERQLPKQSEKLVKLFGPFHKEHGTHVVWVCVHALATVLTTVFRIAVQGTPIRILL